MNRLQNHQLNIILYDLIYKLNYRNIFSLPKLKKLIINIGIIDSVFNKKKIIPVLLFLEIITGQKGFLTKSSKNKIQLKIKKGSIIGCKITLRKKNLIFFLEKLLIFVFPKIKNFKGFKLNQKNIISFNINDALNFIETENEFTNFQNISNINLTLCTNTKELNEFKLYLNSFNFPTLN